MTETVLRPKINFPNNITMQQQGQQGRIDIRRLEAARANRQAQLRMWDEYDRKMRSNEGSGHSLKRKSKQSSVNFQNNYVLIDAVLRDDKDEVRHLLEKGMNPNVAKDDGLTPLHQACINDSVEMCELLVRYGADVNCRDADQWTPLHAAAASCHVEVCEFLLAHGADILAINVDGSIPYDLADDDETSHFLVSEIHRRGYSPADVEAARSEPEKLMLNDIMQRYKRGDDLTKLDEQGAAPIHVAAACGYLDVACVLLRIGVDPDLPDADGWTPAHVASCWRQDEVIQTLVAYGADLSLRTPDGQTVFDLCETDEQQEHLVEIWNNRDTLRMQLAKDSSYAPPRDLQRKRSSSSVHRSSLREKTNLSKREVVKEMEIARNTGQLLGSDSLDDVVAEPAENRGSRVIHLSNTDATRRYSNNSNSSDTEAPSSPKLRKHQPGQQREHIKIIRPPTGYDMSAKTLSPDLESEDKHTGRENNSAKDHIPPNSNESLAVSENQSSNHGSQSSRNKQRISIVDHRGSVESRNRRLSLDRMQGTTVIGRQPATDTQPGVTSDNPKPQLLTPYEAKADTPMYPEESEQGSDCSSNIASCCRKCTIL